MEMIVCIKYAWDISEIQIDPAGKPELGGVPRRVSDIDKNAVEAALNLKEEHGGAVKVLCFGPGSATDGLKEVLAMGADEAYLVEDPSSGMLDTAATAEALGAAVQKIGRFDLILCGEATIDGYTGQVGPRLAAKLGIPQITYARTLDIDGNSIVAQRDLEEAYITVKASIPVMVSVTREINTPRIPSLINILKASKKPITVWKPEEMGITKEDLEHISTLQTLDLVGSTVDRKRIVIKDRTTEEAVQELISFLIKEKVLGV